MKLTEAMKKLPTKEVLGKLCWSPSTCAKVIGVNRNTIINWANKTKQGLLDMPLISAPVKGSAINVPRDEFVDWVSYGTQNYKLCKGDSEKMQAVQMELFAPPKEIPLYEIKEAKRIRIMDEEWERHGRLGNIREYVRACELRYDKELGERYDERDDERLDDNDVIDNCFSCGKPITAGMMRHVDAICWSWTHKDGTPVTPRACWGNPDCKKGEFNHEEGRPLKGNDNPTHHDDWLHYHYLRLCGLTEAEYREKLKREQPTVYEARVKSGYYKEVE